MRFPFRAFLAAIVLLVGSAHHALADSLYDGSLGSVPSDQGWLLLDWPLVGPTATESYDGGIGATRLDTTTGVDSAGYFARLEYPPLGFSFRHPGLPVLDRQAGYRVRFDVKVNQENHASGDRAGFSVIALSDDLWGIELGFWSDEVWAQSGPAFQHAEGASFDTTAGQVRYELEILGDRYSLLADGSEILGGPLRDYSPAAGGDILRSVYALDNFLFLGDDTSSATASFDLAYVGIDTGIGVPEPATLLLLLAGAVLVAAAHGRHPGRRPAR